MKIVETDNFGGDYPDEKFLNLCFANADHAQRTVEAINAGFGDAHRRYYKVVPDNYVLQPGLEPCQNDGSAGESAIIEAQRLHLSVRFGPAEVSESGGFGVAYADHQGNAFTAFVALVEEVREARGDIPGAVERGGRQR